MNKALIERTKNMLIAKYPRFSDDISNARFEYRNDLKYKTAATDGKDVFFDPDFLAKLDDDQRIFVAAHELMHKKFKHMFRLEDKNGVKRDIDLFNEACDAVINANLERDGFTIMEGFVNRPEAIEYTVEEFYEILLQEQNDNKNKQQDQNNQQDGSGEGQGQSNSQGGGGQNESDPNQQNQPNDPNNSNGQDSEESERSQHGDDHSMWEEIFKEMKERKSKQNKSKAKKKEKGEDKKENKSEGNASEGKSDSTDKKDPKNEGSASERDKNTDYQIDEDGIIEVTNCNEKEEFIRNRVYKVERAKTMIKGIVDKRLKESEGTIDVSGLGDAEKAVDWRLLVRREVDSAVDIWSQRKGIAENNYAYRLEEYDNPEKGKAEVMVDISGSVDIPMIKGMLRQLKPLLKEAELSVGCFNLKFWGLKPIKSEKDIDNFSIPREWRDWSNSQSWDLAVRSFSKSRETTKFVFTDGCNWNGDMPADDLKHENVLWLVYDNEDFDPCCGKVIMVDPEKLLKTEISRTNRMSNAIQESEM